MRRVSARLWTVLALVLAFGIVGVLRSAGVDAQIPATGSTNGPSRDEIFHAIGADDVRADYVVLIDTSGSMAAPGRYDSVQAAMQTFLRGLSGADRIAIYTFDTNVSLRYSGSASDSEQILTKLPGGPNPNGQTDIGQAINAAVDEFARPDSASVGALVLLTDGEHAPGPGSPYPLTTGDEWTRLAQRVQTLSDKNISAYAVPLAQGASGASLLQSVFPRATVLDVQSVDDLREFFGRAKNDVRVQRARSLLEPDATLKPTAATDCTPTAIDSASCRIVITNPKRLVPVTLTDPTFDTVLQHATLVLQVGEQPVPREIELAPGATFTRNFRISLSGEASWANPFEGARAGTPILRFAAESSSPWQESLRQEIDLEADGRVTADSPTVPLSVSVSSIKILSVYLLAIFLIVFGALLVWGAHRQRLSGWMTVSTVFPENEVLKRVRLQGRATALSGGTLKGRGIVVNAGGGNLITRLLRSRRREVLIQYSPDSLEGHQFSATCPAGESVIVGGLSFRHSRERPRS